MYQTCLSRKVNISCLVASTAPEHQLKCSVHGHLNPGRVAHHLCTVACRCRALLMCRRVVPLISTGHALRLMNIDHRSTHIFDLEHGYDSFLNFHLARAGHDFTLHLGEHLGDLLRLPLERITPPLDLICAGPPCPPWASGGLRRTTSDSRSSVFLKVLEWVVWAVHRAGLLFCVIENVVGILHAVGGNPPVLVPLSPVFLCMYSMSMPKLHALMVPHSLLHGS